MKRLIERVRECGFVINLTLTGPELVRIRESACMDQDLLKQVRQQRELIIDYLRACGVCGRDTGDAEDRERLKDCAFCDRTECPHKERNRWD